MNKNNTLGFLALFIFSIFSTQIYAQKYSNEFLSIGIGGRAAAMGGAMTALSNDVMSSYWNPAGLAQLKGEDGLQIGAMHNEWFGGISKHDYLGVTIPTNNNKARIGLSIIRLGIDGIPNTLSLYDSDGTINFDNVTEFSAADYAFVGSYARPIKVGKGNLYAGGNVKIVHRTIGPFATSWGFGADLGLQYNINKWHFGAMFQDITTTFNAWSINFTDEEKAVLTAQGNEITIESLEITKPQFRLGMAYDFKIKNIGLRPAADLIITTDGQRNVLIGADPISMDLGAGIEADYKEFLFIRAGVNQFQKQLEFDGSETQLMRPSFGVGLKLKTFYLDYAYSNPNDGQNTYSHIVSLKFHLKPKHKG